MVRRQHTENEPLIIDRGAAAEIASAESIREWAHGRRAFISSVMSELSTERQAAAAAIRAVGGSPVMFELFGGRDADPEDAYLGEVETSDVYICILGGRYGKPLRTRFSATNTEYMHAEKAGLRIATWCSNTLEREGHQQAFLDDVRLFHVVPTFVSPEDLKAQVEDRWRAIAAEDLSPWCKLGGVIFRASEVIDSGDVLQVTARVRSDEVAHALETMRGDSFSRGTDARFTWAGRSRFVRATSVKTVTTTARSRTFRLQLERREAQSDPLVSMSVNGRSAAELTEIGLRTTLFGERSSRNNDLLGGFYAEMPDPLAALREARLPDEIIRPVAELLLVDALVGGGRASRVTEFRLGAVVQGRRRLRLGWEPPRVYTSVPVESRVIAGDVQV